jgi:hypothetical protein
MPIAEFETSQARPAISTPACAGVDRSISVIDILRNDVERGNSSL